MKGVSVIVCTYNGKLRLAETVNHILNQQGNFLWELIIVDNASTDGTAEFCHQILTESARSIAWKIVYEEKPGLSQARICGFRQSQYDILLYCDDDNSLKNDYLEIGYSVMSAHPVIGALGGCGIPVFEGSKPDWFDRYSHSFAVGQQAPTDGRLRDYPSNLYGAGIFFRKSGLLNFFNKDFKTVMDGRSGVKLTSGEDVEWCYLVQLSGYEIWYDHRLTFLHAMPAGRMQWSYYLRLKEGIASGAGRLLPYSCLLKKRDTGLMEFSARLIWQACAATLVYSKLIISTTFMSKPLKPEMELALTVFREKSAAYFRNGWKTAQHFQRLRKLI